jgi:hypothetical protein
MDFQCPICFLSHLSDSFNSDGELVVDCTYPWAQLVRCENCHPSPIWWCRICQLPLLYHQRRQLSRHHYNFRDRHATPRTLEDVDDDFSNDPVFGDAASDRGAQHERSTRPPPSPLLHDDLVIYITKQFDRMGTQRFYETLLRYDLRTACQQLAASAIAGQAVPTETASRLKTEILLLPLARCLLGIGDKKIQQFLSFLGSLRDSGLLNDTAHSLPLFSLGKFHSVVRNPTRKWSLYNLLPTPSVIEVRAGQAAYVPFEQLIHYSMLQLLVHGSGYTVAERHERLVQTSLCVELRRTIPHGVDLVIFANIWCDGWDPSRSLTKINKSPIWTSTATLVCYSLATKSILFVRSLVFAAAPGKGDHTAILDCMTRTLESTKNELRTVVGQRIPAIIANRPCYLSADQPERRELVGLLRGNSNLHALFGLSCDFLRLDKPFVACLNCTTINRVYIKHGNHSIPLTINCSLCYSWTIAPQGQRMNLVYKSPIVPLSSLPVDCGVAGLLNVAPGYLSSSGTLLAKVPRRIVHRNLSASSSTRRCWMVCARSCRELRSFRQSVYWTGKRMTRKW